MKKLLIIAAILLLIPSVSAASYDLVVARGDFPVDAIVSQVYTQKAEIPRLTISRTGINQETEYELYGYRAQGYKNVLIIGGEDAISKSVESDLEKLNFTVTRLWDWNRYGTAARVAVSLWEKTDTVVVAPGDQSGTLISAGRIAIDFKSPLLLVETNKVPDETKTAITDLGATRIILAGNVSENVKNDLAALGGLQPTEQKQIEIVKRTTDSRGLFVIGIVVGGLVIFLVSSLFSVGVFRRKMEVPGEIFSGDELKVLKEIEKGSDKLIQEELPRLTGFSKQKVARITDVLEERDIIEKKKIGKNKVLILKRPVR